MDTLDDKKSEMCATNSVSEKSLRNVLRVCSVALDKEWI